MNEHGDRPRTCFGRGIDALDRAGKAPIPETVDRQVDFHAHDELGNVIGRNHCPQLHLRQIDDGDERRIEAHFLARLDVALGDDSRQRRRHDRVAQRVPRELGLRFVRLERALAYRQIALGAVVGVLRDEFLFEQLLILRPRLLRHGKLGAARFERADPIGKLGLEIGSIEARDDLSRLHRLALANRDLTDFARYLRLDGRLVDRLQRAGQRQPPGERFRLDVGQISRRKFECDRRRPGASRRVCGRPVRPQRYATRQDAQDQKYRQNDERAPPCEPCCHD